MRISTARATQAGDVRHTWADLRRATEELGYAPKVGLHEGLRREAEWLRAMGAAGLAGAQRATG